MPYQNGIQLLERLYQEHEIGEDTMHHAHNVNVSIEPVCVRLTIPGYKYKHNGKQRRDFRADFIYDETYLSISHSDIAVDLFKKSFDNPGAIHLLRDFVLQIGIQGHSIEIPTQLGELAIAPPPQDVIMAIQAEVYGHRLTPLTFGIPITHIPNIIFWTTLNEEVNYSPNFSAAYGGRRTAFKRYLEAIWMGEVAANECQDGQLRAQDVNNMKIVIERVKAGKCVPFQQMPQVYNILFDRIDHEYQH